MSHAVTAGRSSPLSVVLLTWVNLAVLLVNFWITSRSEVEVTNTARTMAAQPSLLVVQGPDGTASAAPDEARVGGASAAPATLDEAEFERVVEAVFVGERVRARVSALRQAIGRLEERGEVSPLTDDSRSRIVALGRRVATERARMEKRLLQEDSPSLASLDRDIATHDDRVREDARRELQGIVGPAEAEQLLRYVAPLRQSFATAR